MNKTDIQVQRIATKALITDKDGSYLLLREADTYEEGTGTGRYQIPGGRLDVGENFQDGLAREVMEETGLEVDIVRPLYVGEWRPTIKGVKNQIVAIFFLAKAKSTDVVLSEEHDHFEWCDPATPNKLDVMDPDDKVIEAYQETLKA